VNKLSKTPDYPATGKKPIFMVKNSEKLFYKVRGIQAWLKVLG